MCYLSKIILIWECKPEYENNFTYRSEHSTYTRKKWTLVRSWTEVVFHKLWLLEGRFLCVCVYFAKPFVFYINLYVTGQWKCWTKDYKELCCQPFLCFSLNFLLSCSISLPQPHPGFGWVLQCCRLAQGAAVIHSWTHTTETLVGWIGSVWLLPQVLILFTGCFVIVTTLKEHFFFISTIRLSRRRLFPIEVYSYQDVFLLFYKY